MNSRSIAFGISVLALTLALAALLVHARSAEAPSSISIAVLSPSNQQPVMAVFQCRTVHETLFLKILGNAKSLTAEPIRYITAQCVLKDAGGNVTGTARSLSTPEVLLQSQYTSFEIVVPFDPGVRRIELRFEEYGSGRPIPVDARRSSALLLEDE